VPHDIAKGMLLLDDIYGDCLQRTCDGHGGVDKFVDPSDHPTSSDLCFAWSCAGWTPVIHVQEGYPCATSIGATGVCDEKGDCVQCLVDTDCPKWGDRCHNLTCVSCGDNTQNGGEAGIDCGGPCGACLGASCIEDADCAKAHCIFTNDMPVKVCCDAPCDGSCMQCSTLGGCEFVPSGMKDVDTCNSPTIACNGSGQCKTKKGYMCMSPFDCISNICISGICN
jgi:hypothetical protein